jgi:hypothetical protein
MWVIESLSSLFINVCRFGEDKSIVVAMPDDVALATRKVVNTTPTKKGINKWILSLFMFFFVMFNF